MKRIEGKNMSKDKKDIKGNSGIASDERVDKTVVSAQPIEILNQTEKRRSKKDRATPTELLERNVTPSTAAADSTVTSEKTDVNAEPVSGSESKGTESVVVDIPPISLEQLQSDENPKAVGVKTNDDVESIEAAKMLSGSINYQMPTGKPEHPVELIESLSVKEKAERQVHEEIIKKETKAWHVIGQSLKCILSKGLYRDHLTFEAYVKEVFGFSRIQAYYLIHAYEKHEIIANGIKQLIDNGLDPAKTVLPTCEWQIRALTKLNDENQVFEVWQTLVADAGGKSPTGKQVFDAVKKIKAVYRKKSINTDNSTKTHPVSPQSKLHILRITSDASGLNVELLDDPTVLAGKDFELTTSINTEYDLYLLFKWFKTSKKLKQICKLVKDAIIKKYGTNNRKKRIPNPEH